MPSKKKKYNARFPPARIKKIMQTDEDVGKVAAAVPVIISRALELFIESLILKSNDTTQSRNARTLSTAHIKHIIESEKKFDFLRDLVANIADIQQNEEDGDSQSGLEGVEPAPPAPSEARAAPAPAARSNSTTERPAKRPRGRPRKIKPEEEQQLPPKKRGRRKKQKEETTDDSATEDANSNAGSDSTEEAASPAAREADGAGVEDGGDMEGSSGMPFARYTGQSSPASNRTTEDVKPVDVKPELVDEAAHRVSPTNSDIKDEPETKEDKKVPGHQREQGLEQQSDPVSEEASRRRHPTLETSVANHEQMARSAEAPTGPGYSTHPHHLLHPASGIPPYPVPAHMPMPTAANNCSVPGVPHPYPGGFHPSLPPPPTVPTAPLPPFQMPMSFYGSYTPPPTGGPTPPPPRLPPPAGQDDYDS